MKKVIIIILILLSINHNTLYAFSTTLKDISLQLKWKYQFQFAGFIMAKEKGFYRNEGLKVKLKEFNSAIDITKEIENGKSEFGIGDSTLILELMKKKDVVGLMAIFQRSPFVLITLKSSNIKDLKDIDGKDIALFKSAHGITISGMLKANNVSFTKKMVNDKFNKLISGEIDIISAYISNEVYRYKQMGININVFNPTDYGFDAYGDILFTSNKFLKSSPKVVEKMRCASLKGWKYAYEHIEETIDIIYTKYNTLNKTKDALRYEARILKELSGYDKNFGELKIDKIERLSQLFGFMMSDNSYGYTDFNSFIYKKSDNFYLKYTEYEIKLIISIFLFILTLSLFSVFLSRRDNKKLKELINTTIEGIAIFENNKLVEVNSSTLEMFGYNSVKEMIGKDAFSFIPRYSYGFVKEQLEKRVLSYELTMKKRDGTLFPVLIKVSHITSTKTISSFIDLTILKEREQELQILNQSLIKQVKEQVEANIAKEKQMLAQSRLAQMGEMISMIAHQWRQPLTAISSTIINIDMKIDIGKFDLENQSDREQFFKFLETKHLNIIKYVKSMSSTIDDFRTFFKPNKKRELVSIITPIKNALSIVEVSFSSKGIDIETDYKIEDTILIYPNEIMQVILNILNNSKDNFLEKETKNPKIIITTEKIDNIYIIKTSDNGGGISKDIIKNIFDPYFSTKNEKNGTGLGLYMSKTIIKEHHNGDIVAYNNDLGVVIKISLGIIEKDKNENG